MAKLSEVGSGTAIYMYTGTSLLKAFLVRQQDDGKFLLVGRCLPDYATRYKESGDQTFATNSLILCKGEATYEQSNFHKLASDKNSKLFTSMAPELRNALCLQSFYSATPKGLYKRYSKGKQLQAYLVMPAYTQIHASEQNDEKLIPEEGAYDSVLTACFDTLRVYNYATRTALTSHSLRRSSYSYVAPNKVSLGNIVFTMLVDRDLNLSDSRVKRLHDYGEAFEIVSEPPKYMSFADYSSLFAVKS